MFNIKELVKLKAIKEGVLIKEIENGLSEKLWAESSKRTKTENLKNLYTGKTKTLSQEAMVIICRELKCTADDICGL